MKVSSMIPADNWFAIYQDDVAAGGRRVTLVCWALTPSGDGSEVIGMVPNANGSIIHAKELTFDDGKSTFKGYGYYKEVEVELVDSEFEFDDLPDGFDPEGGLN